MAAKPNYHTDEHKRTDRHNDLFGLTTFQFEWKYKACIKRRRQNEPQILNIVFPIKTGNRYLEYLENTKSQQTGNTILLFKIYKSFHRKLKIEQYLLTKNTGVV
jgi:hypothetical protein